jgi:hypothetical protein
MQRTKKYNNNNNEMKGKGLKEYKIAGYIEQKILEKPLPENPSSSHSSVKKRVETPPPPPGKILFGRSLDWRFVATPGHPPAPHLFNLECIRASEKPQNSFWR